MGITHVHSGSNTKGQVVLWVVLGLLLLIIAGIFLFVLSSSEDVSPDGQSNVDVSSVQFMVQECIRDTATEGVRLLGEHGNYISPVSGLSGIPDPLQFNGTAYWIIEYNNVQPILNSSVDEFEEWFNIEFENCVDYTQFPGFIVEEGRADSRITYAGEQVLVNVHYPLNISRSGQVTSIEQFDEVLNIRYRRMYEKAKQVVEAHYIQDFDYRDALAYVDQGDFLITYVIHDASNLVFTIADPDEFEGNTYSFTFATNLNRTFNERRATFTRDDTRCLIPFTLDSPDRLATVMILCGTYVHFPDGTVVGPQDVAGETNVPYNFLSSLVTYEESATRLNVPYSVSYQINKGKIQPGTTLRDDVTWTLTQPTYSFGPSGVLFKNEDGDTSPQPLVIHWDEERNQNYGPVGLLYRGSLSSDEWVPVAVEENYQESYVATNIAGFSEYAIVDCSFQQCQEASVTAKVKGGKGLACLLKIIGDLLKVIFVILIVFAVFAFAYAFLATGVIPGLATGVVGTSLTFGQLATYAVIGGVAYAGLTMAIPYEPTSDDTSVTSIPTCDQIVDVICSKQGKLKSGFGLFNEDQLPKSGLTEHTVEGGEPFRLSAVAKKCKTKKFKCSSCGISCRTAFK